MLQKAAALLADMGGHVRHYTDEPFEQVYEPSLFCGEAGYLYLHLRTEAPEKAPCLLRDHIHRT